MQTIYEFKPAVTAEGTSGAEYGVAPYRAIVVGNIIASDPEGDTGHMAAALATELDTRTFATRRPYSGSTAVFDMGAKDSMRQPHANARLAKATGNELNRLCEQEGVTELFFAVHSAMAAFGIEIVASDTTPTKGLLAVDPPAIFKRPPFVGQLGWMRYTLDEARNKPNDLTESEREGYDPPQTPPSVFIPRQLREIYMHSRYWRSTEALDALYAIGDDLTAVTTHLILPMHSPNVTSDRRSDLINNLNSLGYYRQQQGGAPFTAEMADTWHNTYNVPGPMRDLLRNKFPDQFPPAKVS